MRIRHENPKDGYKSLFLAGEDIPAWPPAENKTVNPVTIVAITFYHGPCVVELKSRL